MEWTLSVPDWSVSLLPLAASANAPSGYARMDLATSVLRMALELCAREEQSPERTGWRHRGSDLQARRDPGPAGQGWEWQVPCQHRLNRCGRAGRRAVLRGAESSRRRASSAG